jgi:hypothetical protein
MDKELLIGLLTSMGREAKRMSNDFSRAGMDSLEYEAIASIASKQSAICVILIELITSTSTQK